MKYTVYFANGAIVTVEVDPAIFTDEWMQSFRKTFYNFDTVRDHIEHLASLAIDNNHDFWEGYGPVKDIGIMTLSIFDADGSIAGTAVLKQIAEVDWDVEFFEESDQ